MVRIHSTRLGTQLCRSWFCDRVFSKSHGANDSTTGCSQSLVEGPICKTTRGKCGTRTQPKTRKGLSRMGPAKCSVRDSRAQQTRGFATLVILLIWLPIFSLFGGALWLLGKGRVELAKQKKIDQCLFHAMSRRCEAMSQLSFLNEKLTWIQSSLVALQAAKAGTVFLPGASAGALATIQAIEAKLRAAVSAIVSTQSLLQAAEKTVPLSLLTCGFPKQKLSDLRLDLFRKPTTLSRLSQTAAPLFWKNASLKGELHWMRWDFTTESFAHCAPKKRRKQELMGQAYSVEFTHPLEPKDNSPWRP